MWDKERLSNFRRMSKNGIIEFLKKDKSDIYPEWRSLISDDLRCIELNNFSFRMIQNMGGGLKLMSDNELNDDPCYRYDILFGILDIYDKVHSLILNSNYINKLPNTILRFKYLKILHLIGTKLWNLMPEQIPLSVEELIIESHVLSRKFYYSLSILENLRILGINQPNNNNDIVLPLLTKLKEIYIYNPDSNNFLHFLSNYSSIKLPDINSNEIYITHIIVKEP